MANTVLTTDHPAWQEAPDGTVVRLTRSGAGLWLASWDVNGTDLADLLDLECIDGAEDVKPRVATTSPSDLAASVPAELRAGLQDLGLIRRLANPSLWDAITTAILRQVVQARHAREKYRTWCRMYGTTATTKYGPLTVAPDAQRVLELADDDFAGAGAKFNRTALQAAAHAYLEHGNAWSSLTATDLVAELVNVPRIGPWTASAAAADFTGDFTVYPHADLAVRTWAARIAPGYAWPKPEGSFGDLWRRLAGTGRWDLHTLTLTTLTWGAHARTAQHGGIPARP